VLHPEELPFYFFRRFVYFSLRRLKAIVFLTALLHRFPFRSFSLSSLLLNEGTAAGKHVLL